MHAHCVLKELPFVGISDHFRQLGKHELFFYKVTSFSLRVILFSSAVIQIKHELHCLIPEYTCLQRISASVGVWDGLGE